MPWTIAYNTEKDFILITYSGRVIQSELIEAFKASGELMKQHNTLLILSDCSKMIGGHSVLDLYSLISLYKDTDFPKYFKEAILMPDLNDTVENVQFYETACLNRGYNVKIFNNNTEAINWLTGKL